MCKKKSYTGLTQGDHTACCTQQVEFYNFRHKYQLPQIWEDNQLYRVATRRGLVKLEIIFAIYVYVRVVCNNNLWIIHKL